MSFLAPYLLGLAAFAGVPILLHLIRRKRIRILDFPTFRFIQKAAMQRRIHLRLQDRLLMLLRVLVILLLILAFAGPLTSRSIESEGPVLGENNLLIVDDSLSMSAFTRDGVTLSSKALEYARDLTRRADGEWRVAFAGDIDSASDFLPTTVPDDFFDSASTWAEARGRFSIFEAARKAEALADWNTVVWTLTDAAASNWLRSATAAVIGDDPLNFLVVGEPWNPANWAIRELTLNNQPLLENEPALLTAVFERFGPASPDSDPTEIEFEWSTQGDRLPKNYSFSLTVVPGTQGRFQTALEASGTIASASCRLIFPEGSSDALAGDDSVAIFPRTLGDLSLTVLAGSEIRRRMLIAALVDYRSLSANPIEPPPENLESTPALVLVLGAEAIHEDWTTLIRSRLEAGAGVLVLYDERTSGARLEVWSKWWTSFGERIQIETLEPGFPQARGGSNPWFAQSLQEILLARLEWAEGGLELVVLPRWEGEWWLGKKGRPFIPIFQTGRVGSGLLASFAVPLSLEVSPLILEPYWVPLLSQMVKRTLFDPETSASREVGFAESDLASLSNEARERLSVSGCRFLDAGRFMADVEKLPSRSHDWTLVCLLVCLGLAIVEIAVSNLV